MKLSIRSAPGAALLGLCALCALGSPGAVRALPAAPASGGERLWGPVVGVMYAAASPAEFNAALQEMYPNSERDYVPLLTQFGVNFEQRIALGDTASHLAFQEMFTIGGIDQGMALPSLSVQLGFRSRKGPQFGLGPILMLRWDASGPELTVSVVYSLGWGFTFHDAYVPLTLAVVPTPGDGQPTFGLFSGFDLLRRSRRR